MPLQPGTRLGPYDILSALGAGGMGEVYRARDSRLDRDVAIKVLPAAFAQDATRVARFEREAKAIAALSHPNLLAIFDTGLHDGHPYVVTELLDGETLATRLAAGPVPIRKAIEWGSQIARGLAAAHGKGIVHRDLKPDNVFLTADGHAKILDFGLAKTADAAVAPHAAAAATMTATPITDAGTVMGTVGYMSPEQVRGESIDARSDLFSFGAVLYEMLTGARAFRADTTAETMTAILREDPPEVSTARSQLSPALDRIVHHCLEKQPGERFQTARDVAFALEALSGSGSASAASVPIASARRFVTPERIAWSAVILALFAAIGVLALRSAAPVAEPPVYVATLPLPEGVKLTTGAPLGNKIALSPDGRHLAFIANQPGHASQLWLQTLDGRAAAPVQGSDAADGPFWSPDSRFVAFRKGPNVLKVAATGGAPTTVASIVGPGGRTGSSGTWNAADTMLVDSQESVDASSEALWTIAKGGSPAAALRPPETGVHVGLPTFLPDGQHFIYAAGSGAYKDSGLYLGRLGSTDRTRLAQTQLTVDNLNAYYAAGYLLSVRGRNVIARAFDPAHPALGSEATTIAGPVEGTTPGTAAFSISQTGVLVYQPSTVTNSARLVWHDRTGREMSTLADEADYSNLELSPDGSQLLVAVMDANVRTRDIWVVDVARGVRTRVTFDPSEERSAVWTPDGKAIVYTSRGLDLYTKAIGGSTDTPVVVNHLSKDPRGISPDGKFLLFRQSAVQRGNDLWILPMQGDTAPTPFLNTPYNENGGVISPDGRWVAYESDESGRPEIYVTGFPTAAGKWQISIAGGSMARWRRDGREMFYLAPDNTLMSVKIGAAAGQFTVAAPVALFRTTALLGPAYSYDVSADGERFIIADTRASTLPPALTIVFNWPQLLKQTPAGR